MDQSTLLTFQHSEHKTWMSQLDFYQDEINIFQKELAAVLLEFSDLFSIIEHVDEYRNILLKKLEQLDELRRQITLHERKIVLAQETQPDDLWDHNEMRTRVEEFISDFEKMKVNFKRFVSRHLKRG